MTVADLIKAFVEAAEETPGLMSYTVDVRIFGLNDDDTSDRRVSEICEITPNRQQGPQRAYQPNGWVTLDLED